MASDFNRRETGDVSASLTGVEDDFTIDDFHFAVIPAPSALAILGTAGLVALRRRR